MTSLCVYENGYHYYVLDNGDYYYYKMVMYLWKNSRKILDTQRSNPTPTRIQLQHLTSQIQAINPINEANPSGTIYTPEDHGT